MPGRCGKKLKRTDPPRYCTNWPAKGRTTCGRVHGGTTPRGPASPHYKHGRRSRLFNVELHPGNSFSDAVLAALKDPDLRSLKREIAVTSGLISISMERVASSSAGPAEWKAVKEAVGTMAAALRGGNVDQARKAIDELERLVTAGSASATAEAELRENTEQLRKLRDTEAKLAERGRGMVRLEEFLAVARAMADIGAKFITASKDKADFVRELERVVVRGQIVDRALPPGEPES